MKSSDKKDSVWSKAYKGTKKLVSKALKPVKKYAPATMIMLNSLGSFASTPKDNSSDRKIDAKTITVAPKKVDTKFTFNNMEFDLATMHVEDLNVLFISGNNSAAMYGGKTMGTVKDFGPMLNKLSDLKMVIEAHPEKYADLISIIEEYGIRSDEFKNIMAGKYNDENKRRELAGDIIDYFWEARYQPIFDANAKIGYPEVTFKTKSNPETFGYVSSVITCMGQSSRQTPGIYKEAMERAHAQFGEKATLGNCVDASYDIRYERWGLYNRVYGKDGISGEKFLNQKIREMFDSLSGARTLSFENAQLPNDEMVVQTDAIKSPLSDSLEIRQQYDLDGDGIQPGDKKIVLSKELEAEEEVEDSSGAVVSEDTRTMLEKLLTRNGDISFPSITKGDAEVILPSTGMQSQTVAELEAERARILEELDILNQQAEKISKDKFSIMRKKMVIDYAEMQRNPEIIGHYFESARNPVIKDSKSIRTTKAMGLYQFNMSNTMKTLANKFADEFPLLKKAKDAHGVRSPQYEAAWRYYSLGPDSARFEKRQLELMFDQVPGSSYKENFDWMTEKCGAPVVTLDNYNDPEICVYAGSIMSSTNQNPSRTRSMAKKAYERVKKRSATGEVDWNEVGIVLNDIKAEKWGKNKALYRRYMGTKHNIGEKQMCQHLNRYVKEMPRLRAQIAEKERKIQELDYALNFARRGSLDYMASNAVQRNIAMQSLTAQVNNEKLEKIQLHVRNVRKLSQVKKMVTKNNGNQTETPRVNNYTASNGGNEGGGRNHGNPRA